METILKFLPKNIADIISKIPPDQKDELEEIRIRINRPIEIMLKGAPRFLPYVIAARGCLPFDE